jgi:hypothetical protein
MMTKQELEELFRQVYMYAWEDALGYMVRTIDLFLDVYVPEDEQREVGTEGLLNMQETIEEKMKERWPDVWLEIVKRRRMPPNSKGEESDD